MLIPQEECVLLSRRRHILESGRGRRHRAQCAPSSPAANTASLFHLATNQIPSPHATDLPRALGSALTAILAFTHFGGDKHRPLSSPLAVKGNTDERERC